MSNPYFNNPERASYEFGYLLRNIPQSLRDRLPGDQLLQVEAAELHALNATGTLLRGLQSVGHVMWAASQNEENQIDARHFGNVGLLVSEVALQLQLLDEFRQQVSQYELRSVDGEVRR